MGEASLGEIRLFEPLCHHLPAHALHGRLPAVCRALQAACVDAARARGWSAAAVVRTRGVLRRWRRAVRPPRPRVNSWRRATRDMEAGIILF